MAHIAVLTSTPTLIPSNFQIHTRASPPPGNHATGRIDESWLCSSRQHTQKRTPHASLAALPTASAVFSTRSGAVFSTKQRLGPRASNMPCQYDDSLALGALNPIKLRAHEQAAPGPEPEIFIYLVAAPTSVDPPSVCKLDGVG